MSQQVNINNLRTYLTKVVANQIKTTQPAYANQFSLVNAVTTTSSVMNINPKTGTITITGPTGSITVDQPVINPIPINTPTAFISTNDDKISVTSKGEDDTIITSNILSIGSITQLNTGSNTLNNSIENINNNISTDFWNPQRNINQMLYGYTSYPYILNYNFTGTIGPIYKLYIKNLTNGNYTYPGFKLIKIYETENPLNYINVTPSLDINNLYNNETVVLLLNDEGEPYFNNIRKITMEIDMNTYVSPSSSQYSYGPNTGIKYNKLLNEGKYMTAIENNGYIYTSSNYGIDWISRKEYIKNWKSVAMSYSGQYQTVITNNEYIYTSSDYGVNWIQRTEYIKNWKSIAMSSSGQYQTVITNNEYIYTSSDYGVNWIQRTEYIDNWSCLAMTSDGLFQILFTPNYKYISQDSGETWSYSLYINDITSISISNNGDIMNIFNSNGEIYISTDKGINFDSITTVYILNNNGTYTPTTNPQNWSSVSNNGGGGYCIATVNGGQIFISSNFKNLYSKMIANLPWISVSCSESSKYIIASATNNNLYISDDFGSTWKNTTDLSLNWSGVAISRGYSDTNNIISLRAGDYISYNEYNGQIDKWSSPLFVNGYSSMTGTSYIDNQYMGSSDGLIQVVSKSNSFSHVSIDGGKTWNIQSGSEKGTYDMVISNNGQYALYTTDYVPGIINNRANFYISNNYSRSRELTDFDGRQGTTAEITYYVNMSRDGKYQFFISNYNMFFSKNYGKEGIYDWNYNFVNIFGDSMFLYEYLDSFVNLNGKITIAFVRKDGSYNSILITSTPNDDYSTWNHIEQSTFYSYRISSINKNYNNDPLLDGKYISVVAKSSILSIVIFCIENDDLNYASTQFFSYIGDIEKTGIVLSSDGEYQVATWTPYLSGSLVVPNEIWYSDGRGTNWIKCNQTTYINILKSKNPIIANDDLSYITICGGFAQGNIATGYYDIIKPCTYSSINRGATWNLNSSINPATQLQLISYYYPTFQTNKIYFQIKDLNQNPVLGVSDNGFKMSRDLRVTNSNGYVIGGTMTIGPDEASTLLNNYSLNVDGTVSCRNVVTLSDKRFKDVVGEVSDTESYNKLDDINIIKYKYIDRKNDNIIYTGMIAQDVYKVFNDAVDIRNSTYSNNEGTIELPDVYSIRYNVIMSYLISAFKGAKKEINELKEEINKLKNIKT
jgi:hypothetical protein